MSTFCPFLLVTWPLNSRFPISSHIHEDVFLLEHLLLGACIIEKYYILVNQTQNLHILGHAKLCKNTLLPQ